jgi:hypothetical protein
LRPQRQRPRRNPTAGSDGHETGELGAVQVAVVGYEELVEPDADARRFVDQQGRLGTARDRLDGQLLIDDQKRFVVPRRVFIRRAQHHAELATPAHAVVKPAPQPLWRMPAIAAEHARKGLCTQLGA